MHLVVKEKLIVKELNAFRLFHLGFLSTFKNTYWFFSAFDIISIVVEIILKTALCRSWKYFTVATLIDFIVNTFYIFGSNGQISNVYSSMFNFIVPFFDI